MKGTWKTAEAWCCERSGEAIDKVAASLAAEGPGLKGHAEVLKVGTMKRA